MARHAHPPAASSGHEGGGDLERELAHVIGWERLRIAGPDDAVLGVQPKWVVEPGSVEEAGRILALADHHGVKVAVRGGGTKLRWGNPPRSLDLILSTARLNRVLEHASGDLVARVEAGARLKDVQTALSGAGQWLALDPPEEGATIGGAIAANATGPRRLRYGSARDLLIGATYVLPNGTIAKAGGKVVKNVAGYDLCKLLTGSFGTLALLSEVTVRLHPLPPVSRTVLRSSNRGTPDDLFSVAGRIVHSHLTPTALDFAWNGSESMLAARFESIEPSVEAQTRAAMSLLNGEEIRVVEDAEEAELWSPGGALHPHVRPGAMQMKIGCTLTALPAVMRAVMAAGAAVPIHGHAGSGIVLAEFTGTETDASAIVTLRSEVERLGGYLVVLSAPDEIKRSVDSWGEVGGAQHLMSRVKARFDPNGTLNPGRFVAGI